MASSLGMDISPSHYDVFIVHSSVDEVDVRKLKEDLEREKFKVAGDWDFISGHSILQNIIRLVETSRRVLIFMTQSFKISKWCAFELLQALYQNVKHQKQLLIPVKKGIRPDEIPHQIRPINYVDYDALTYDEFLQKIVTSLKAPDIPMDAALPIGDVAHGLAWSYFYGYLKLILPGLRERIMHWAKSQTKYHVKKRVVPKLFILMPATCFCWPTLTEADPDPVISIAEHLSPFTANRAGNPGREYRNTIYEIAAPDGEKYYCAAEFATPLMSLYEMEDGNVAGLSNEEKMRQKILFSTVLTDILNHGHAGQCKGAFHLVDYDDQDDQGKKIKVKISKIIMEEIRKDLQNESQEGLTRMGSLTLTE